MQSMKINTTTTRLAKGWTATLDHLTTTLSGIEKKQEKEFVRPFGDNKTWYVATTELVSQTKGVH